MPRDSAQTRALFDAWSATYARDLERPSGPLDGYAGSLRAAAKMALAGLRRGEAAGAPRVLDLGIGTGAFGAILAEGAGARVSGLDVSPGMIARCAEAHPDFALAVGGFLPIPHPDAAFEAVVSSFALHEVAPGDRPAALAEVARVLVPGGELCLLDIIFASAAALADAQRAIATWDPDEEYPLVGELDAALHGAGLGAVAWQQTAPCHWAVQARR